MNQCNSKLWNIMLQPCFAFVAPVNSPEASPETTDHMDICYPEWAEGKAPSGGGQRGDSVPRRHHDGPRSHYPGGQESVLGVRHGRLRHRLRHLFRLESRHEPLHHRAHQWVQRWRRWRGGVGRSGSCCIFLNFILTFWYISLLL